jgi:mono/diheme cytochrome c family protein
VSARGLARWLAAGILTAGPLAALAVLADPACAQPPASTGLDGKALYHEKCLMCHGPGGMGTGLLQRRVQPAELAKRTNLTKAQVMAVARAGLGNMPPVSRGEVSDRQLAAIADYLVTGPEASR